MPVVLFDLASAGTDPSAIARGAMAKLKKLSPAPLSSPERLAHITAANYDSDLAELSRCDLVIEAIAEKQEWKADLFAKISPHLGANTILASNTSGLSINGLADCLPVAQQGNFCGIHFFNPPRYMSLVELIPTRGSDPAMLDALETWLTQRLGKGIIRAKDTPNFIANRVGVFSMLAVMHHAEQFGLGFDVVDALTGPKIGRPKSATYRTADVVGLDTFAHVVNTMHTTLGDDPWYAYYQTPNWLKKLIAAGNLGQKTKCGVFRKEGKTTLVFDPKQGAEGEYRPSAADIAPEVAAILQQRDPAARFTALRACAHPQAQFLWAIFRDVFHYCAVHLGTIADNARDVDFALRWGFAWQQGPFEIWQSAGWQGISEAIQADIAAGKTMAATPLPDWVKAEEASAAAGVHSSQGSWSAATQTWQARSTLPVYQRQLYPASLVGELRDDPATTLWENDGVRLWTHPCDDGIAIVSFKTKMHAIGQSVLAGLRYAIDYAEQHCAGLVIWHEGAFAAGADLKYMASLIEAKDWAGAEAFARDFQAIGLALKYAQIPTVAAVQGLALGGGCEIMRHCRQRVLALESYVGLVEAGVGLIPGGGGCKEQALAAAAIGQAQFGNDPFPAIQHAFDRIAYAKTSKSAHEAVTMAYANDSDPVVFHASELLYVALRQARALAEAGYRPALPATNIPVAGRNGLATLEMNLVNLREGGFISAHDFRVARAAAFALCGGEVESGSLVDEAWLLAMERQAFLALLQSEETQARIRAMLDTGKPLRN